MGPEFDVDGLWFAFESGAQATPYDEWAYFNYHFKRLATNVRAMDVVCIHAGTCWLIEAKDYRQYPRTKPSSIADELTEKVRDTLAGLTAAAFQANVAEELALARDALDSERLRVVLHLEQPRKPSRLKPKVVDEADLKQKLKQRLRAVDPRILVVDQDRLGGDLPWSVTG